MAKTSTDEKPKVAAAPGDSNPPSDAPRLLDLPAGRRAEVQQFPSLYGKSEVEVAERTSDSFPPSGAEPTDTHVKVFVAPKVDYETEADAVHGRNINAVRQYMLNQGLRPDADVTFVGAEDWWDGVSVALKYEVGAVPAAVATTFDLRHTVVPQDGPTPTELAEFEAKRVDRLVAARDAVREGTPEADRPEGGAQSGTA